MEFGASELISIATFLGGLVIGLLTGLRSQANKRTGTLRFLNNEIEENKGPLQTIMNSPDTFQAQVRRLDDKEWGNSRILGQRLPNKDLKVLQAHYNKLEFLMELEPPQASDDEVRIAARDALTSADAAQTTISPWINTFRRRFGYPR